MFIAVPERLLAAAGVPLPPFCPSVRQALPKRETSVPRPRTLSLESGSSRLRERCQGSVGIIQNTIRRLRNLRQSSGDSEKMTPTEVELIARARELIRLGRFAVLASMLIPAVEAAMAVRRPASS
jgi:hypothetical protein